jgi:hypothetical protein
MCLPRLLPASSRVCRTLLSVTGSLSEQADVPGVVTAARELSPKPRFRISIHAASMPDLSYAYPFPIFLSYLF